MAPLVATLVYQLIRSIPEISDDILLIIERDPLIFKQALEWQLQHLIIQPLLRLQRVSRQLFVVFIDRLDECVNREDQANVIKVLGQVSQKDIPVIFLIASRREPRIQSEFSKKKVADYLEIISLDEIHATEDIRRYLCDKFSDIKSNHIGNHSLPTDWPKYADIEQILAKSSGQFIYAAVVMNYVSSPDAHPAVQLDVIKGIRPRKPSSENPFAYLDALYQHIFSQVKQYELVRSILAMNLVSTSEVAYRINCLEPLFELARGELEVILGDLASVLQCEPYTSHSARIKFLHASLPDFFVDKSRSEEYYIDRDECRTALLCMFLQRPLTDTLSSTYDYKIAAQQETTRLHAIGDLLTQAKVSDRLHRAVTTFDTSFETVKINAWFNARDHIAILTGLKNLNFGDKGETYRKVLSVFASGYAKHWNSMDHAVRKVLRASSDLYANIIELRPELQRRGYSH